MPGNIRGVDATQHCPDESLVLAYTRQQLTLGEHEELSQHIQRCAYGCQQKFNNAVFINDKLGTLATIQEHLRYPALWPSLQPRMRQEQQRRLVKKLSYVSMPIACILALILVLVFALAYSHFKGTTLIPGPGGFTGSGPANVTGVVSHRLSPTPTRRATQIVVATVGPSATASATPTPTGTPAQPRFLQTCSMLKDLEHNTLRICGVRFTPGDQVTLTVVLRDLQLVEHHPVMVNAQGMFTETLDVGGCRYVPIAIYALDVTKNLSSSNTLQDISFKDCSSIKGRRA